VLERADRLQRQFCQLGENTRGGATWEPPIDVFKTEDQLIVVVALPGVAPECRPLNWTAPRLWFTASAPDGRRENRAHSPV
jgi:HSP20 family molecular chaperone IbpA